MPEGHAISWFEPVALGSDFQCCFCKHIAKTPLTHQQVAGHEAKQDCFALFCESCAIHHLKDTGINAQCPACACSLTETSFHHDTYRQHLIAKARTKCPNEHCSWSGSFGVEGGHLFEHMTKECEYRVVPCRWDTGCPLLPSEAQARHEASECRYRRRTCDRCKEDVYEALGEHNCSSHLECPNQCYGRLVLVAFMQDASKFEKWQLLSPRDQLQQERSIQEQKQTAFFLKAPFYWPNDPSVYACMENAWMVDVKQVPQFLPNSQHLFVGQGLQYIESEEDFVLHKDNVLPLQTPVVYATKYVRIPPVFAHIKELQRHVARECPFAKLACPYASIGCTEKCSPILMQSHLTQAVFYHAFTFEGFVSATASTRKKRKIAPTSNLVLSDDEDEATEREEEEEIRDDISVHSAIY